MNLDKLVENLYKSKVDKKFEDLICQNILGFENIGCIADNITITFNKEELCHVNDDSLYTYLQNYKKIGQIALNCYKKNMCELTSQQCIMRELCEQTTQENCIHCDVKDRYNRIYNGMIKWKDIIEIISKYVIIFNILHEIEFHEICPFCDSLMNRYNKSCSVCDIDSFDKKNKNLPYSSKKKESLNGRQCFYCDNDIFDGVCSVCGAESMVGTSEEGISNARTSFSQQNNETFADNRKFDSNHLDNIDMSLQSVHGSIVNMDELPKEEDDKYLHNSGTISKETLPYWECKLCSFHNMDLDNDICGTCMSPQGTQGSIVKVDRLQEERDSNHLDYEINTSLQGIQGPIINTNKFQKEEDHDYLNNSDTLSKEIPPYWECKLCSFHNMDLDNNICGACMSLKDIQGPIVKMDELQEERDLRNSKSPSVHNNDHAINIVTTSSISTNNCKGIEIEPSWNCTHCTYKNEIFDKICKACLEPNKDCEEELDIEFPEETWICKECRANNSYDRYKCHNCRALAPFVNKWRCEKCSFYNDKLSRKCGACERFNDNLSKCPQCRIVYINNQYDSMCERCIEQPGESSPTMKTAQERESTKLNPKETVQIGGLINQFNVMGRNPMDNISTRNIDRRPGNSVPGARNENLDKRKQSADISRPSVMTISDIESNKSKNINIEKRPAVENIKAKKRNCRNCKIPLKDHEHYCCAKCESQRWCCQNEKCDSINFGTQKYCSKCKAGKNSKFSNCHNFSVFINNSEQQMWQCRFCWGFNPATKQKCSCGNLRDNGSYKKCFCKWNNLSVKTECEKCGRKL